MDVSRAQGEPGVHASVEADHADGAAVPASRRRLVILDELHGPVLRRAGHRDRPHVGEERVQRIEAGTERAFHVIDSVDEPAVQLDLPPADDLDAARHADPRLVVAVHVRAHGQLRLFLRGAEQRANRLGVGQRVLPAGDRARNRACLHPVTGHPHVHLRRRADQVLVVAEVEEELVRRRIALAQPLEEGGRGRTTGVESMARHHLEKVAAGELLPGPRYDAGVTARHRIGRKFGGTVTRRAAPAGRRGAVPGQADRAPGGGLEIKAERLCRLPLAVHGVNQVGQVQYQIAVGRVAPDLLAHRLELERQVVAERAVQAQVRARPGERGDDLAERGKHRRPTAALLLGEDSVGPGNGDLCPAVAGLDVADLG